MTNATTVTPRALREILDANPANMASVVLPYSDDETNARGFWSALHAGGARDWMRLRDFGAVTVTVEINGERREYRVA